MSQYGYKESRLFISKEKILKRVSQEEIFKMILGFTPKEYSYTHSPFRKDDTPNCYFEWYKGMLWFIDWAEPVHKRHHRDCFNMVQDHHKVSFYNSLEIIDNHFKLNLLAGFGGVKKQEEQKEVLIVKKKKIFREMPFKARMFNNQEDRDFWQPYQITRSNLIEDEVFPIIWYKIYSRKLKTHVVIRPNTRSYMVGNFDTRSKFYTPDKKGIGKWSTNCTQNDIWGLESLPLTGKQLVITKSYKDYRVLKNQGVNVIAFQNEGMTPSPEILNPLLERFEEVIILFDNDRAGIEAAVNLMELINSTYPKKSRYIHLNVKFLKEDISDPADFIKGKGRKPLQSFLERNKVTIIK